MDFIISQIISLLSLCSPLTLTFIEFLVLSITLMLSFKYLQKCGIYVFTVCTFITANIQVLREVQYFFQDEPVALGTVAFSLVFLANNILVEKYGIDEAKKNIYSIFYFYLFFNIIIITTLSYDPKTDPLYIHLEKVFINFPRLFVASVISYFISQFSDIYIFNGLKKIYGGLKFLWLRNFCAIAVSGLVDNTIFSLLAWKIFASEPVSFNSLIFTYILGTYWFRLLLSLFFSPLIYIVKKVDVNLK